MEKLTKNEYKPRCVDSVLDEKLAYSGAVCIRGPKWCGKTETALQHCSSAVMMQDPDSKENNLLLAQTKPSLLLAGEKPRLIDEWQEASVLWDAVRYDVDKTRQFGQYILTGSATPVNQPSHSGTGRFSFLDMLPMSLFESGDSTAEVSLEQLFAASVDSNKDISGNSPSDIEAIAYLVCRGGWPLAVSLGTTSRAHKAALEIPYEYVTAVVEEDVSRVDGVSRNTMHARMILREYARITATQTTHATIRKDLKESNTELARSTVDSYIAAFRQLYVVQDLDPWTPSLHAKSRISKTPTRHFADPSLAAAALGATPELLFKDMSTFGLLFESLCVRDLRVYASAIKGEVFHYHDESGLEADAVVVLRDGRYALFEVKMSAGMIDDAASNLLKLKRKINTSVMGEASFCAVLTTGGYAYRRTDGVFVVPITCLAP